MSDVLLVVGNALVLVGVLGPAVDDLLLVLDAHPSIHLPGTPVAPAAPEKEICRGRDYKRGVRGTAGEALAG